MIKFFPKLGLALLLYCVLALTYVSTNHWIQYRHAFLVNTSLEDRIPFVPQFVYLYIFGYLMLLLFPLFFVRNKADFYLLTKGILFIIVSSGIVFCVFPTTTLRPSFTVSSFTLQIVNTLYELDPPNNCFPSLHVALTAYIAIILHRLDYWKNYPLIISGAVCASTLFIKEHALIDIIGGLIYASLTIAIFWQDSDSDSAKIIRYESKHCKTSNRQE